MASIIQSQSQKSISSFQKTGQYSTIGNRRIARLDIGMFCPKDFFDSFQGQQFRLIRQFTASHEPFSRIPFRIFVGEYGSFQAGGQRRCHILRGDQANGFELPFFFSMQQTGHFRIENIQQFYSILFYRFHFRTPFQHERLRTQEKRRTIQLKSNSCLFFPKTVLRGHPSPIKKESAEECLFRLWVHQQKMILGILEGGNNGFL